MIHKLTYKYDEPDYEEKLKIISYPSVKENTYMISNYGRVFRIKKNGLKEMKTYFDDDDHEKITLVTNITQTNPKKRGNKQKHFFVHRLLIWEFIGPPPDDDRVYVNHKNGIPCCNLLHNLEWCTVLENTNHAKKMGLLNNRGVNYAKCKYNEKFIRKICLLFENGYNNKEIFEIVMGRKRTNFDNGIYSLINKLGKRLCYHDITCDYDYNIDIKNRQSKFDISKIQKMIKENKTNLQIMKEFGYTIKENKKLYNRIIYERSKCK